MKIWLTTVAGCFMSGCKNHRMGEPARLGNDSTQITATLEFIAATILICKHVIVCKHWFSTSFDYIILHLHTPKISKVSKLERTMRLNLSHGEVWMDCEWIGHWFYMPMIQKFSWLEVGASSQIHWFLHHTLRPARCEYFWDLLCKLWIVRLLECWDLVQYDQCMARDFRAAFRYTILIRSCMGLSSASPPHIECSISYFCMAPGRIVCESRSVWDQSSPVQW